MARCSRCGMDVPPNTIHIFWGGEERRLRVERAFGSPTTLCGMPLSDEELRDRETGYMLNEKGEWVEVELIDGPSALGSQTEKE